MNNSKGIAIATIVTLMSSMLTACSRNRSLPAFLERQISPFSKTYREGAVYRNLSEIGCINPHTRNRDQAITDGLRKFNKTNGINLSRGWAENNPSRVFDFKPCPRTSYKHINFSVNSVQEKQRALINKQCLQFGQDDNVFGDTTQRATNYFNRANHTNYDFQNLTIGIIKRGQSCNKVAAPILSP